MDVKFGTSGLRGKADELLAGAAARYTRAFCEYCRTAGHAEPGAPLFVARDLRASSPQITEVVLAEINREGFKPVNARTVPTPALASYAMAHKGPIIMVTGSHIPADRNGLKFYLPTGEINKKDETAITALAKKAGENKSDQQTASAPKARKIQAAVLENFRRRYEHVLPENALSGMQIGIYEHSSVAVPVLRQLLEGFGAKVIGFGATQTFTPVDTEALEEQTRIMLLQRAASLELDAIISTDADGDRPLITDGNGAQIPGDLAGCITAELLGVDAVATPVTSNSGISAGTNFEVKRTRVGSPYVIAAMEEMAEDSGRADTRIVAGFEANGGFLLGAPASVNGFPVAPLPTRDSVLPILAVLARIATESATGLKTDYGFKQTVSGRIPDFPTENSTALMKWLGESDDNAAKFMAPFGGLAGTDKTDGFRFSTRNDHIVHLRPSGNAPEMRIYCEAETARIARELFHQVRTEIMKYKTR
ncbi:MAG: phosphomannomutase [Pseudomonadota bacterium]